MKTTFSIFLLVLLVTFLGCAARTKFQRPGIQGQPLAPGDLVRVPVSNAEDKQSVVGPLVAQGADTSRAREVTPFPRIVIIAIFAFAAYAALFLL